MHLVEIDVVGLQSAQARLDFRHDVPAREAYLIWPNRLAHKNVGVEAHLGGDDEILSPLANYLSENFLRRAGRIDVGSVDKITADFDKTIENCFCNFFFGFSSKRHGSETKLRNLEPGAA